MKNDIVAMARDLLAKSTPGPWASMYVTSEHGWAARGPLHRMADVRDDADDADRVCEYAADGDAEFMSAARFIMLELCLMVDKLEADVRRLEERDAPYLSVLLAENEKMRDALRRRGDAQ